MAESKILKAYCSKSDQYFGLEIRQFGSTWKVVNVTHIDKDKARLVPSEIRQDKFETANNLIACPKCGKRVVGGCSCAKKKHLCAKGMKYLFDCIYCSELKIDYSLPRAEDVVAGKTVKLAQGQEVKIQVAPGSTLKKIIVGVGWTPTSSGPNMDIDSSVFVAGRTGVELVYFGDLDHPSGCVHHHGDNLTGENKFAQADDENITVYLNKVPRDRDRLVFVLNIYDCVARGQILGNVRDMYIRLYDPDSMSTLVEYRVTDNMKRNTALIIGEAYRRDGDWYFKAIGRGSYASGLTQLGREIFGI